MIRLQELDGFALEDLAHALLRTGLAQLARQRGARAPSVSGYLRGIGSVRVYLRTASLSPDLVWDLESEARQCVTHRQYIGYLRDDLARGGLGILTPAFRMELDERSKTLENTRQNLRGYLQAVVEALEVFGARP